ncbi:DNA binding domain-containing protein, excisionase family [Paraburkholderia tropica]|uniref:hypothetical protein n=1 Tax=Paraburkholderia tropica TaxID=92647 RepID=UPI001CB20485|nr:hypothetical protein [Paraburkholderia tropica]CAG9217773.1 DNA binding domain-containing protein, excisionase family [Paraburkholderia tropica]
MTLADVAEFLFVSQAHVKKLLTSGAIVEVLPNNPSGAPNIDVASVEKYKAEIDAARRAYLDSQTEDDAPQNQ